MNRSLWSVLGVLGLSIGLLGSARTAAAADLKVGDKAPAFSLQGSDGKTYSLDRLQGQEGRRHRLVPEGVHRRLHRRVQVDPREQRHAQAAERRLLHRQRRRSPNEQEVRRVARPRLPDPQRPGQEVANAYGVVHAERKFADALDVLHRQGRHDQGDRQEGPDPTKTAGADLAAKIKELGLEGK